MLSPLRDLVHAGLWTAEIKVPSSSGGMRSTRYFICHGIVINKDGASIIQYETVLDIILAFPSKIRRTTMASINSASNSITLDFASGAVISATRRSWRREVYINFIITVPPDFYDTVTGIFGYPNGVDDDLQTRDGTPYDSSFVHESLLGQLSITTCVRAGACGPPSCSSFMDRVK